MSLFSEEEMRSIETGVLRESEQNALQRQELQDRLEWFKRGIIEAFDLLVSGAGDYSRLCNINGHDSRSDWQMTRGFFGCKPVKSDYYYPLGFSVPTGEPLVIRADGCVMIRKYQNYTHTPQGYQNIYEFSPYDETSLGKDFSHGANRTSFSILSSYYSIVDNKIVVPKRTGSDDSIEQFSLIYLLSLIGFHAGKDIRWHDSRDFYYYSDIIVGTRRTHADSEAVAKRALIALSKGNSDACFHGFIETAVG